MSFLESYFGYLCFESRKINHPLYSLISGVRTNYFVLFLLIISYLVIYFFTPLQIYEPLGYFIFVFLIFWCAFNLILNVSILNRLKNSTNLLSLSSSLNFYVFLANVFNFLSLFGFFLYCCIYYFLFQVILGHVV